MIITPLGHTEFLIDIENSDNKNIRILVDGWFSDFSVGDLMERTVKVRLDREKIKTIDALYISHSHTDHFDPYTLMEIYEPYHVEEGCATRGSHTPECEHPTKSGGHMNGVSILSGKTEQDFSCNRNDENKKPLLLLPFTLAYLVPLIREYLGDISIEILSPGKPYILHGIEIAGHVFPQSTITNEDDVMMLSIDNGRELLFAEIDTLPEDDDEDVQNQLYKILTKKEYETVCYLASRNELEGQLPLLDLPLKKRKAFRAEYIAQRKDAIYASYQKYEYEDFIGFENIYTIPNLVRGFIGQGIGYPETFSSELSRSQIFPLEEIASMESDIARECGYEFPQKALLPGRQYKAEFGTLESGRKECSIGQLSVTHEKGNLETTDIRTYALGPLFPRVLDADTIEQEKKRILEILNTRFLPYWSASPLASLRSALMKNNGVYRISFCLSSRRDTFENQVGEKNNQNLLSELKIDSSVLLENDKMDDKIIFEYSTARSGFIEVPYSVDLHIDENYWFLDVVDFLDGRQELYSNFWHKLDPKSIYRLWTCLGANFCNNDLIIKKYRLHFERAKRGETSSSFFEEMKKSL